MRRPRRTALGAALARRRRWTVPVLAAAAAAALALLALPRLRETPSPEETPFARAPTPRSAPEAVPPQPGLVPRLQPLRWLPEVESYLYAHLRGLPIHNAECPHLGRAQRGRYRAVLHGLQEEEPGVAHALVRSLDRMRPGLESQFPPVELASCPDCGEPSPSGGACKACSMRVAVRGALSD